MFMVIHYRLRVLVSGLTLQCSHSIYDVIDIDNFFDKLFQYISVVAIVG